MGVAHFLIIFNPPLYGISCMSMHEVFRQSKIPEVILSRLPKCVCDGFFII